MNWTGELTARQKEIHENLELQGYVVKWVCREGEERPCGYTTDPEEWEYEGNEDAYRNQLAEQQASHLASRFLELSPLDRRTVASELGLLHEGDDATPPGDLWAAVFERAKVEGLVGDLLRATQKKHRSLSGETV